jgi:hypothetical protein
VQTAILFQAITHDPLIYHLFFYEPRKAIVCKQGVFLMEDDFESDFESSDRSADRVEELESRIEELEEGSSVSGGDIAFVIYGAFGYFVGLGPVTSNSA